MQGELNSGLNNNYIFKNLYLKNPNPNPFLSTTGVLHTRKQKPYNI